MLYHNALLDNAINGRDDGNANAWDEGAIGNYWGDYEGTDEDGDGIGEVSYHVSGSAHSQDDHPLIFNAASHEGGWEAWSEGNRGEGKDDEEDGSTLGALSFSSPLTVSLVVGGSIVGAASILLFIFYKKGMINLTILGGAKKKERTSEIRKRESEELASARASHEHSRSLTHEGGEK